MRCEQSDNQRMRSIGTSVVLSALALIICCLPAQAVENSGHFTFEREDGLWGRVGANGAAELLSDKAHYQKADGNGMPCYVLIRSDEKHTWIKVLECNAAGELQRVHTVTGDDVDRATAVMGATFLPDGRLKIDLHVSPSVGVVVLLDLKIGQQMVRTR